MNLRLDSRSVRIRLDIDEARALLTDRERRQRFVLLGLDLSLVLIVSPATSELSVSFSDRVAQVLVSPDALASAVARVPARDAGVYAVTEQGFEQALEIDSFSVKKKK